MTIDELEGRLARLGDRALRYQYIVQLGRRLPPMPPDLKTPENQVRGCMSAAWLAGELRGRGGDGRGGGGHDRQGAWATNLRHGVPPVSAECGHQLPGRTPAGLPGPRRGTPPSGRAPGGCVRPAHSSGPGPQKTAIGFSGEPVAPGMGSGAAMRRNSHRPRSAAASASASRSQLSSMCTPR